MRTTEDRSVATTTTLNVTAGAMTGLSTGAVVTTGLTGAMMTRGRTGVVRTRDRIGGTTGETGNRGRLGVGNDTIATIATIALGEVVDITQDITRGDTEARCCKVARVGIKRYHELLTLPMQRAA